MLVAPPPSVIHVDAIKTTTANAAMYQRNMLVQLWIMGTHVKRLMNEHLMTPNQIAEQTGVDKQQLYSAVTVRDIYETVQDIPNG